MAADIIRQATAKQLYTEIHAHNHERVMSSGRGYRLSHTQDVILMKLSDSRGHRCPVKTSQDD